MGGSGSKRAVPTNPREKEWGEVGSRRCGADSGEIRGPELGGTVGIEGAKVPPGVRLGREERLEGGTDLNNRAREKESGFSFCPQSNKKRTSNGRERSGSGGGTGQMGTLNLDRSVSSYVAIVLAALSH